MMVSRRTFLPRTICLTAHTENQGEAPPEKLRPFKGRQLQFLMIDSHGGVRMGKRAAIYVRVSTDKQTVENQLRELRQIAERRGWEVVHEYHDAGISGAKSREARLGLDELLRDAQRRRFDIVMAWAIDRLGRSLIDLLGTIQTLEGCEVDLYLDQQSIDTTTPSGRLMFQITGAFAEFERSMIRQRVRAGLKRAVESGKQLGRPKIDPATEKRIKAHLRAKRGMLAIARDLKVGTGTVQRVPDNPCRTTRTMSAVSDLHSGSSQTDWTHTVGMAAGALESTG
jgi:DNA invertase Pin-like site-specific DNA recombinase